MLGKRWRQTLSWTMRTYGGGAAGRAALGSRTGLRHGRPRGAAETAVGDLLLTAAEILLAVRGVPQLGERVQRAFGLVGAQICGQVAGRLWSSGWGSSSMGIAEPSVIVDVTQDQHAWVPGDPTATSTAASFALR